MGGGELRCSPLTLRSFRARGTTGSRRKRCVAPWTRTTRSRREALAWRRVPAWGWRSRREWCVAKTWSSHRAGSTSSPRARRRRATVELVGRVLVLWKAGGSGGSSSRSVLVWSLRSRTSSGLCIDLLAQSFQSTIFRKTVNMILYNQKEGNGNLDMVLRFPT